MPQIKRKDVEALSQKLESFAKGLPDQERHVLGWLIDRAQAATDTELSDAQLESASGGLANSLGFGPGTDSVGVNWTKSFNN